MYPYHITITGDLGSGKSTLAKELSIRLNFPYFSTGELQRKLAEKREMDTLSLNKLSEKDRSIDDFIDSELQKLNLAKVPYVIDSRLAWHFIRHSFKVFLSVKVDVAALRILQDQLRTSENNNISVLEKIKAITERKNSERKRFKELYHLDCSDLKNYDIVIDTTYQTPNEISNIIIENYEKSKS